MNVSRNDWMTGMLVHDFHVLLSPYLLAIDLQQLVRVNHFWHDKVRYDLQKFYLSDETFTWAKSFKDLSARAYAVLDDFPSLLFFLTAFAVDQVTENLQSNKEQELKDGEVNVKNEEESHCMKEEVDANSEHQAVENNLNDLSMDSKEEEGADDPPPEIEDDPLTEENEDDDYTIFLQDLDKSQGSSHRNICSDPYFFSPENDKYRQDFCQLLLNPAKQLCLYLQNTSLSDFRRFNIRPWKIVFLMTRMHPLHAVDLHYLNHIDTVELHGNYTIFTLDGLTGIRVLGISNFTALRTIRGNLTTLEEVHIDSCGALVDLIGLESAKRVRLDRLRSLEDISLIQNCEELSLHYCSIPVIHQLPNLRSLTIEACHFLCWDSQPKLQKLVMLTYPSFIKYPTFPNLQIANLCLSPDTPLSKFDFLLDLQSLTVNYDTETMTNIFGGFDELMMSRFRNLRELTIEESPSLTSLTVVDALPLPLRKITIVDCPLLESLEGLSRVQSIQLRSLKSLRKIAGINPTIKSLFIGDCDIQDWTGVTSVEELTVDYCEKDYDDVSVFPLFGKIVKKKLTLCNSKNINTVIGLEEIPILEFDFCIGLRHFSDSLKNEKIIFDKVGTLLYPEDCQQLCRNQRYTRDDYGDKIVFLRNS